LTGSGTLLIGVADDGTIVGIEQDYATFESRQRTRDQWQQRLRQAVYDSMGPDVWATLNLSFEQTEAGTVARIECPKRDQPTYLMWERNEEFYCRAASSSEPLTLSKVVAYVSEHWPRR
jgi:hypothetical protein